MDKRILITGANGALAKETIKHLLKDGFTDIVMGCRTESKGEAARTEIINETRNVKAANITVAPGFDMNEPLKIEMAIRSLSKEKPFDIVFLAAGFAVFEDDYQLVKWNGKTVEKNIFQNLFGSHITLSLLKKHGLLANHARVVLAGGEGARGIKGMIDKPSFASPTVFRKYVYGDFNDFGKYNPMNAIGVSKLCGALWTSKIAELQADHMEVIWFSPGLTSGSEGLKNLPFMKRAVFGAMFGFMNLIGMSQTPQKGGRKFADCLNGKIGKNGDLLGAPAGKAIGKISDQSPLNSAFTNQGLIDELWTILEEVTGPFDRT